MTTIYRLFKAGAITSLTAMITVVAIQVFSRVFLEASPHWTEEAARIFFIYSVGFGTGIGIKRGDFIRLDLIGRYLSPATGRVLDLLTDIAVAAFAVIIIIHSISFVRLGMDELSPALEITMGFVFLSITLTGISILLFTLAGIYGRAGSQNLRKP